MDAPRLLADSIRDLLRHEPGLPAADPVHDLRVASRRLRAALRLVGLRELDAGVKALQDALGEVRDLQLQIDWLSGRDEALRRGRALALKKAEGALEAAVRTWRDKDLPALLGAARSARAPVARKRRKILRRRLQRLAERLRAALERSTPRAMHGARISVKQVRYLVEMSGEKLPRFAGDLKPLQASLGELHDVDVRIHFLRARRRSALLREQIDARAALLKVVTAQLRRWERQRIVEKARRALG